MKLPRPAQKKARIEIIPMIDTMFFLLVFFMIATLSMTTQYNLPVNLPYAGGVQDNTQKVVTLTINNEGGLFFNQEKISSVKEATLRLKHEKDITPNLAVILNADRSVEHGKVIEIMDAIHQTGITRIAVAVNPAGDK